MEEPSIHEPTDLVHLCRENDEGNIEYKWKLIDPSPERLEHLTTQLQYRLNEGQGEAFYELGVDDSGFPRGLSDEEMAQSLETINKMTKEVSAEICAQVERKGEKGKVVQLLVRQYNSDLASIHLRVAVCGNVDSGKSTLISVLTRGGNDNGRGSSLADKKAKKEKKDGPPPYKTPEEFVAALKADFELDDEQSVALAGIMVMHVREVCERGEQLNIDTSVKILPEWVPKAQSAVSGYEDSSFFGGIADSVGDLVGSSKIPKQCAWLLQQYKIDNDQKKGNLGQHTLMFFKGQLNKNTYKGLTQTDEVADALFFELQKKSWLRQQVPDPLKVKVKWDDFNAGVAAFGGALG